MPAGPEHNDSKGGNRRLFAVLPALVAGIVFLTGPPWWFKAVGITDRTTTTTRPGPSPTRASTTPPQTTTSPTTTTEADRTTWLDEVHFDGQAQDSEELPDANPNESGQPPALPHELIINPFESPGNVVSFTLGRKFQSLTLRVAPTGDLGDNGSSSLQAILDGTIEELAGGSFAEFLANGTRTMTYQINVSGVNTLQLTVTTSMNGVEDPPLLISGALTGS
jgi:hypothetical protein